MKEKTKRAQTRLSVLKEIIQDEELLSAADRMALTQSELDALLAAGVQEIYLVSNEFRISLQYEHILYIGIDKPHIWVTAEDNCDFAAKDIRFQNIQLFWDATGVSQDDEVYQAEQLILQNRFDEAEPTLKRYADCRHPRAMHLFILCSENGALVRQYQEFEKQIGSSNAFFEDDSFLPMFAHLAEYGTAFDQYEYGRLMFTLKPENAEQAESVLLDSANGGCILAWRALGNLYDRTEQYDKVIPAYEKGISLGAINCLYQMIWLYDFNNRSVIGDITEVARKNRLFELRKQGAEMGDAFCQYRLAELYKEGPGFKKSQLREEKPLFRKDMAQAIYWYEKAAEQGNTDSMTELGEICFAKRKKKIFEEKAIRWFEKADQAGARHAYYQLANLYKLDEDYDNALKWYIIADQKGDDWAFAKIIQLLYQTGQDESAKEWIQKALNDEKQFETEGKKADFFSGLGFILKSENKYEEAIPFYQKAAENADSEKSKFENLLELSECLYNAKRYEQAIETLLPLIGSAEKSDVCDRCDKGKVMRITGDCYRAIGQTGTAIQYYQQEIDAGDADGYAYIGDCYWEQGNTAEAEEWYEKAEKAGSNHAFISRMNHSLEEMRSDPDFPAFLEFLDSIEVTDEAEEAETEDSSAALPSSGEYDET